MTDSARNDSPLVVDPHESNTELDEYDDPSKRKRTVRKWTKDEVHACLTKYRNYIQCCDNLKLG